MTNEIFAFINITVCRKCKHCLISAASTHRQQPVIDYTLAQSGDNVQKIVA